MSRKLIIANFLKIKKELIKIDSENILMHISDLESNRARFQWKKETENKWKQDLYEELNFNISIPIHFLIDTSNSREEYNERINSYNLETEEVKSLPKVSFLN